MSSPNTPYMPALFFGECSRMPIDWTRNTHACDISVFRTFQLCGLHRNNFSNVYVFCPPNVLSWKWTAKTYKKFYVFSWKWSCAHSLLCSVLYSFTTSDNEKANNCITCTETLCGNEPLEHILYYMNYIDSMYLKYLIQQIKQILEIESGAWDPETHRTSLWWQNVFTSVHIYPANHTVTEVKGRFINGLYYWKSDYVWDYKACNKMTGVQ